MITTIAVILCIYLTLCSVAYVLQEKMIFLPEKLSSTYSFSFDNSFEEIYISTEDDKQLHGLLFKTNQPKGLIFYLHGNAGSLASWGEVSGVYTPLGYDIFLLDYRGYGKSEGRITSEQQLYSDLQRAYDFMTHLYSERSIIVLGYSIGTGMASYIASVNNPSKLILQAPFYSLPDVAGKLFPFVPKFLIRYKFENFNRLKACSMPIVIFHGDADEVIYTGSSEKLKPFLKPGDRVIILPGVGHNGMTYEQNYLKEIQKILE